LFIDCIFIVILPRIVIILGLSLFITALHAMQRRSRDEKAVCLSVRLSVRLSGNRVNCDKTKGRSVQIFILYER